MKASLLVPLLGLLWSLPAQAGVFDGSTALGPGKLSLAGEFRAEMESPNPLWANFYQRVGLASGLGLYLREEIPLERGEGLKLGGGLKWTILPDKKDTPGLALWGGGYYNLDARHAGARVAFLIDNRWGRFAPYGALELDSYFSGGVQTQLFAILGLRLILGKQVDWVTEFSPTFGNEASSYYLSTGLRLRLF